MNIVKLFSLIAIVLSGTMTSYGQVVEPEVPGDQFSLEGALELFKRSDSPEEFERLLNSPNSKVNNLDLNADGYIDYVRVLDRYEGNVHAFILQAVISDREVQDIAVIELEKLANGKAVLQIVGNEDIYGIETIIEPTREVRTYAGATSSRTVVNVWSWPSVQYVYSPYYHGWVSPWDWHHRPVWWHRWRPIAYVHYHPIWQPYRSYYAYCDTRRVVYAHHIYHPHRRTSVAVRDRYHSKLDRYRREHRHNHRDRRYRNDDRDDRDSYAHDSRRNRSEPSGDSDRNNLRDERNPAHAAPRRSEIPNQYRSPQTRSSVTRQSRPTSRDRNVDPDLYRDSRQLETNRPEMRERVSPPEQRSVRQPRTNQSDRSQYSYERPVNRDRTAPPQVNRNSSGYDRSSSRSGDQLIAPAPGVRQHQPSRPSSFNRSDADNHVAPQRSVDRAGAATRTREIKRGAN